jgi:hypothetical protein
MQVWLLVMVIVPGLMVAVAAIALAVARSRKHAEAGPRCGNCGYNLTGAPSNRCPECGKLFVDAGVVTHPAPPQRPVAMVPILIALLGGFTALLVVFSVARRARVAPPVVQAPASAPGATTQPLIPLDEQSP